jgi:O-antigen/teichoic acid export membrane protein
MLGLVTKQADVLAVGAFASATAAGHYRLAVSMASLASVVVGPLQAVLFQRFARLRGVGDAAGLRRAARRVAGMVCLPLGLLLLTALPFVPLLVRVLVGDAYRPAAAPAQISLAAVAVWLALAWVRPLAFAVDAVKAWAAGAAAVAAVSLAGFVVLTPMLGALGPAWVRLGTGTAMQAAFAVRLGRRHVAILPGRPAMRGDIPAAPGPRGAR